MTLASRLFSRSRLSNAFQVTLQHECSICAYSFAEEDAPFFAPRRGIAFSASNRLAADSIAVPSPSLYERAKCVSAYNKFHACRCSTLSEASSFLHLQEDFFTFIKSTFSELEGGYHCWLNKIKSDGPAFNENGVFLVLVGAFLEKSTTLTLHDQIFMLERVKLLQQRYPKLQIFGFQHCSSKFSEPTQNHVIKTILEDYVTFPVLLSEKEFAEITNEACFLLFEGFKSPLLHYDWGVEIEAIAKEIEQFRISPSCNSVAAKDLKISGTRQPAISQGPYACSSLSNLLLYYPGCVSADECGKRIFVSDTNHHRIIVAASDGKIIDCIGSSPGFMDGRFESAELFRPAGSVYNFDEDCLYFVDSENHSIRRADMERRVVETIYPVHGGKTSGIWNWIMDKLGMQKENYEDEPESDICSLSFPWHLIKLCENDLLVLSRSFETSWVLSPTTGKINNVIRGIRNVMETHSKVIKAKTSSVKELPGNWLQQKVNPDLFVEGLQYPCLLSATAEFNNNILFCDTAGQTVWRCDRESGNVQNIQFSDFEVLGLPYWLACPIERVNSSYANGGSSLNIQHFSVLPGRCEIWVKVDIPEGVELVAPVQEDCIWRQARGSAVEVTGSDVVESAEKVGVAQQWYDELDNLAFSSRVNESTPQDDEACSETNHHDENVVHIGCAINTSPGTGEVAISAVFYLRLKNAINLSENLHVRENASRLLNLQKLRGDDACINLLLQSGRDIGDIVFMKPLHLRIGLDCADHPTCPKSREIISTNSMLQVDVSL